MIVCICHNVSDKAIRASCCGKCNPFAKTLVRAHLEDTRITELKREPAPV